MKTAIAAHSWRTDAWVVGPSVFKYLTPLRMLFLGLGFVLIFGAGNPAQAGVIGAVLNRADLPATETLDWGEFGPDLASVVPGSALTTPSGLIVIVSQPYYELQVRQEDAPGSSAGGWRR